MLITLRPITTDECPWLPSDIAAGQRLDRSTFPAYGCISPSGVAVQVGNRAYEVPRSAVVETPNVGDAFTGMALVWRVGAVELLGSSDMHSDAGTPVEVILVHRLADELHLPLDDFARMVKLGLLERELGYGSRRPVAA